MSTFVYMMTEIIPITPLSYWIQGVLCQVHLGDSFNRVKNTVAYDRLGYGYFSSKPHSFPRDAKQLAKELRALLDALNIKKVILVGHSLGGIVIRTLLSDVGDFLVEKVVLVDATHQDVLEKVSALANQVKYPNLLNFLAYAIRPFSILGLFDWIPAKLLYPALFVDRFREVGLDAELVNQETLSGSNLTESLRVISNLEPSLQHLKTLKFDYWDKTTVIYSGQPARGMVDFDVIQALQLSYPASRHVEDPECEHVSLPVSEKLVEDLNSLP
jgi:pimeloyl-ACP methyl ester carboxylesterase